MTAVALDQESAEWLRGLQADGPERERTIERLHALLLRVARGEAARRRGTLPGRTLDDVDDLCVHAASDALMAVLAKLNTYRGAARFTTWAYKFAIYETSSRLRRHAWRQQQVEADDTIWDRLPDTALPPLQRLEQDQLMAALDRAIREQLTDRQRMIFRSVTLHDVPIYVLAERLASTRGAIYKTLHDARRKLRQALIEAGYGEELTL